MDDSALRVAAQSLHRSRSYLSAFYGRMRARLGAPQAITATAHKLARILFHLLRTRSPYVTASSVLLAKTGRWKPALLVAISFHLHLLCDVIGARGPDGYQWPVPYLLPFSDRGQWMWQGEWALNAWPNFVITGAFPLWTFWYAWHEGRSPIEMTLFSPAAARSVTAFAIRPCGGGQKNSLPSRRAAGPPQRIRQGGLPSLSHFSFAIIRFIHCCFSVPFAQAVGFCGISGGDGMLPRYEGDVE